MAVDEAVLERYAAAPGPEPPTLRLYGWSPPALSLGRSQPATHRPEFLEQAGIALVRRPSGGRAVLHDDERTYAVIGRLGTTPFPRGVVATYGAVAGALVAGLRRLGAVAWTAPAATTAGTRAAAAACFAAASVHELTFRGRKLVGSAQLRRRGAFLQHGSIPLRADGRRLASALGLAEPVLGQGDLAQALGFRPEPAEVDRALVQAFEERFRARLEPGELTCSEADRAARLRAAKYLSESWTLFGRG
jgi:lipoate-protein ligase A